MPALPSGARLGPYEILAPLGAGGMGDVYRGRDTRLGRTVAVKLLNAELSGDAIGRERFEREARSIAAVTHPHICTVHDVGDHEGNAFLVMELLEGIHARRLITAGEPISWPTERPALRRIASAPGATHAAKGATVTVILSLALSPLAPRREDI